MSESNDDACPQASMTSIADWPHAEVLLLTAFRCWLAGYETGDVACWELAWQGVSRTVPLADAKRIVAELAQFTRVFRKALACRFVYLPCCCARATADEHIALQLVASAQLGDLTKTARLAHKLSNESHHIDLVNAACDLGVALKQSKLWLTASEASGTPSTGDRRLH